MFNNSWIGDFYSSRQILKFKHEENNTVIAEDNNNNLYGR